MEHSNVVHVTARWAMAQAQKKTTQKKYLFFKDILSLLYWKLKNQNKENFAKVDYFFFLIA